MTTAQQQAAQLAAQAQRNANYMKYSIPHVIKANAQNGNNYAVGSALNFEAPIQSEGYAYGVRVEFSVTFNYTAATSAPYATITAAGIYNLFNELSVTFGNRQHTIHPYIAKVLAQTRGYNRTKFGQTLGNSSSAIQGNLGPNIAVAAGNNTWTGYFDFPLNLIHPMSPIGLLPIYGSGTKMQVQLVPTTQFSAANADPLISPISTNGTVASVAGTVNVKILYRDYKSFSMPSAISPDLTGLSTAQVIKMKEINPLNASTLYQSFTNPYPFNKIIAIVVDGQQSNLFCGAENINTFRIDSAENTNSGLWVFDNVNNSVDDYYRHVRDTYGQDFDDGVLIFDANTFNTADSSLQEGEAWLNLTDGGYPAARIGVGVGAVSTTNFVPRVAMYGVILNPLGIS